MLTTFLLGCTFLFIQINEYANIGFAPQDNAQQTIFYSLTGLHGAHVFIGLLLLLFVTIRAFRGHYSPEEHRGVEVPGHLLALRRHHVARRLHDRLRPLSGRATRRRRRRRADRSMLNPLRSEDEAFRLLLYVIAVVVVIVGLIADRARDRLSDSARLAAATHAPVSAGGLLDRQRAVHTGGAVAGSLAEERVGARLQVDGHRWRALGR